MRRVDRTAHEPDRVPQRCSAPSEPRPSGSGLHAPGSPFARRADPGRRPSAPTAVPGGGYRRVPVSVRRLPEGKAGRASVTRPKNIGAASEREPYDAQDASETPEGCSHDAQNPHAATLPPEHVPRDGVELSARRPLDQDDRRARDERRLRSARAHVLRLGALDPEPRGVSGASSCRPRRMSARLRIIQPG